MRYRWPDGKQSAAVLSFDFDAESGFLFREPEKARRSLGDLEERRFGPRVGVDRILRLLDRLKLRASFYIPGWTVEHHPAESARIRDAGHEIGAHGNMHEALSFLDEAQEERVMREQLDILQSRLGVRPAGYRSPSWDVNVWTPDLLKRHGFLYDTSLMGNDVPYEVETGQGPLIEVPVQWLLDDAPLFRHVYGATNAIADPGRVLQMWSKEFARVVRHRRGGGALAREPARGRTGRAGGDYPLGAFAAGAGAPGFAAGGGSVGRTRTGAPLTSESAGSRMTASRAWRPATTSTLRP